MKNETNGKSHVSKTLSQRRAENTYLIETYLNVSSFTKNIE